jgi:hypothetical protein
LIISPTPSEPDCQNPFRFATRLIHLEEIHKRSAGRTFRQLCWKQLTQEPLLLRRAAPGEIPEDRGEPSVIHVLYVPTSIEVAGMFLPSDKAAVQVNQSATGFSQFLASLPKSCQHPMTARIEAERILEFPPRGEMHTGRKVAVFGPSRNHFINTT